jgi:hypothetical protein
MNSTISLSDINERVKKLEELAPKKGENWIAVGRTAIAWGANQVSGPAADDGGAKTATAVFPKIFAAAPTFIPSVQADAPQSGSIGGIYSYNLSNVSKTEATFGVRYVPEADEGARPVYVSWIAIGDLGDV